MSIEKLEQDLLSFDEQISNLKEKQVRSICEALKEDESLKKWMQEHNVSTIHFKAQTPARLTFEDTNGRYLEEVDGYEDNEVLLTEHYSRKIKIHKTLIDTQRLIMCEIGIELNFEHIDYFSFKLHL